MGSHFSSLLITASLALGVFLMSACNKQAAPAPATTASLAQLKREVLFTYRADAYAITTHAHEETTGLVSALATLVKNPSAASLDAARAHWRTAHRAYAQTEALRFGNLFMDSADDEINRWPIDEGFLDYVAEDYQAAATNGQARLNLIAAPNIVQIAGQSLRTAPIEPITLRDAQVMGDHESNVAMGFHPIEFLLWGQDRSLDGPGTRPWSDYALSASACTSGSGHPARLRICQRRGQVLTAAGALLERSLRIVKRQWTDSPGSFGDRLTRGDVDRGLRRMLFGLITLSAQELAGQRIQVALLSGDPEEEQDCFSDDTHASLYANAKGIARLYFGGDTAAPQSLATLARTVDPELAVRIESAIARSLYSLSAVYDAGQQGETFDRLIQPGNAHRGLLEDSVSALGRQAELFQRLSDRLGLGLLNPGTGVTQKSNELLPNDLLSGDIDPTSKTPVVPGLGSNVDPAALEYPPEALPGGATTVVGLDPNSADNIQVLSQPVANLGARERLQFAVGHSFFTHAWVSAPATITARDGLGPLFNASACQDCHIRDSRDHAPLDPSHKQLAAVVRIATPEGKPHPVYGSEIQTQGLLGYAPEATVRVQWHSHTETLADGSELELHRPEVMLSKFGYGDPGPLRVSLRVAPSMSGLGLLEAIPEADLRTHAAKLAADAPELAGRLHLVDDLASGGRSLGRFGWKASEPSVRQQALDAFRGDLGITSSLYRQDACTAAQQACRAASARWRE